MDTGSQQPIFDAIAGSSDGSIPQVDLTSVGAALDANSAATSTGSLFSGFSFSSVPTWAWLLLGGVVALKVLKV